jgi:4-hydroxy-tetrahydrodipicolinate reductase
MDYNDHEKVIPIVIVGARGRMGKVLVQEVVASDDLSLVGAVDRSGSPGIGQDAGTFAGGLRIDVEITDDFAPRRGTVVVDFSLPEATSSNLDRCLVHGAGLVLGTTGLDSKTREHLLAASKEIPIVHAANYSVGVTVLTHLATLAARALGPSWDNEILELHHRHKRDAPSGTALRLADQLAKTSDRTSDSIVTQRSGPAARRHDGEIGVASLRGGDSIGEHCIFYLGDGERIELVHRAHERAIFARGALRAARWVLDRDPGLYDMSHVLGLV